MGSSHGDFIKYPRTPHLFGSKGTDDDKHLSEAESNRFIADDSLIVEEKIDGTNVGLKTASCCAGNGSIVTGRAKFVRTEFVERKSRARTGSIRLWCRTSLRTGWISGHELAGTQAGIIPRHRGLGRIAALGPSDGGLRPRS